MGGLGNNLYQINHGLSQCSVEECEFITNLVEYKLYSKLFGWTYHGSGIDRAIFPEQIQFKRENTLIVIRDLFLLFLSTKLKITTDVYWESPLLMKINFGYFQYPWVKRALNLNININNLNIASPVIHMRLGDSPTLISDVEAQLRLIKSLNYKQYLIVTNDKFQAKKYLKEIESESESKFEFLTSSTYLDFFILSNAKILVCPSSTFSLMAAFFSLKLEEIYVPQEFWKKNSVRLSVLKKLHLYGS